MKVLIWLRQKLSHFGLLFYSEKKFRTIKKVAYMIFWVFLGYESLEFSHFKPFEKYMYFSGLRRFALWGNKQLLYETRAAWFFSSDIWTNSAISELYCYYNGGEKCLWMMMVESKDIAWSLGKRWRCMDTKDPRYFSSHCPSVLLEVVG